MSSCGPQVGVRSAPSTVVRALLSIRFFVGRLFGWDREPDGPGAETFAIRPTTADLAHTLTPAGTREGLFRTVYRLKNEQLLEIQNRNRPCGRAERSRRHRKCLPSLFRGVRAERRLLDAGLYGSDRSIPQGDRLPVASVQRPRDLEPSVRQASP
jgi:hypothetical protein